MAEPFLAEIRLMSFNFPPKGWAFCDGQLLPINQNQALFALLGTTYGGNGQTNFALPDLRDRVPVHFRRAYTLGTQLGENSHTVTAAELPRHTHVVPATSAAGSVPVPNGPSGAPNVLARHPSNLYGPPTNLVALNPGSVTSAGSSQPHENRQPLLTLNFCIALQGIFPSQN